MTHLPGLTRCKKSLKWNDSLPSCVQLTLLPVPFPEKKWEMDMHQLKSASSWAAAFNCCRDWVHILLRGQGARLGCLGATKSENQVKTLLTTHNQVREPS